MSKTTNTLPARWLDTVSKFLTKERVTAWLPVLLIVGVVTASFLYGWYLDPTKPLAGAGMKDQDTYHAVTERLLNGELPKPGQLHFAIGYSLLGVVGSIIPGVDPFMPVSYGILVASVLLCYAAVKYLYGVKWALVFSFMLILWDGVGRTFHFASDLFVVPWNNQLIFLLVAFFFWLFVTQMKKPPSWRLVLLASGLSGFAFLTREETILFSVPAMTLFLWLTKAGWKKIIAANAIIVCFYIPQLIVKMLVGGSVTSSGRSEGYGKIWSYYFRIDLLVRNVWETLINSTHYNAYANQRPALLQRAPWLMLSPIGLGIVLWSKKYQTGLKIFVVMSVLIMLFYLSGGNMSSQKLAYHCLRYISSGFIVLNFGLVVLMRELWIVARRYYQKHRIAISKVGTAYSKHWLARLVGLLPVLLPATIASFGSVAIVLLLLDSLTNWLVWPLGLIAASITTWLITRYYKPFDRPGKLKEQLIVDLLVLVAAVMWMAINVRYTTENVFVNRDPAIYAVAGAWLIDNDNLDIQKPTIFKDVPAVGTTGFGFGDSPKDPQDIHAQGLHLLPVFLGLVGRMSSETLMLRLNPFFGMVALLAVYGYGRLFMRSKWAAAAAGVLAISLPMLAFSRDTFTEPLAMLFTFGSLALIWGAQKTKSIPLWLIAGLTLGAGALTRIDAFLTLIAIAIFISLFLGLAQKGERKEKLVQMTAFIVGAAFTTMVGWFDVTLLSSRYYSDLSAQFMQQVIILASLCVVGLLCVALAWSTPMLKWLDKHTKRWRGTAIVCLILAVALFLMSRPLWYVSYGDISVPLVRDLQVAGGNAADGARDYAEQTTNWIAWYIGPVVALASVGGMAMLSARAVRKKDLLLVPGLLIIAVTAAVFLNRPSITPDQIWASRRLLPVVLPGLALYGMVFFERLFEMKRVKEQGVIALATLATVIVLPPLLISFPYLRIRTYATQYQQIEAVCKVLPANGVAIWLGDMRQRAVHTTQAFCDTPAAGLEISKLNSQVLREIHTAARRNGYEPIILISQDEVDALNRYGQLQPISTIEFTTIPSTLYTPPRALQGSRRTIVAATISDNGMLSPIGVTYE